MKEHEMNDPEFVKEANRRFNEKLTEYERAVGPGMPQLPKNMKEASDEVQEIFIRHGLTMKEGKDVLCGLLMAAELMTDAQADIARGMN